MIQKPDWLKIRHQPTAHLAEMEILLKSLELSTVCHEANCPNYIECFSKKTATFMILGTSCTRNCRFCNVSYDVPSAVDFDEPQRVAQAVKTLGLRYVVITSVTRDDLSDGGAAQFAAVISAIRAAAPETTIEVLIPDFQGDDAALKLIIDAAPDVISHNMETVTSLYKTVRAEANYTRSLTLLGRIKEYNPDIHSKSGIMLGFGEQEDEVYTLFDDLRAVGCEFLTIGQYLAPSKAHYPVQEYITPAQFDKYGAIAREKGFSFVASAPFVRSSYNAGEALDFSSQ